LNSSSDVKVTEWLLENYRRMNEAMFFDPGWENLNPEEVIALRIYAPEKVFTEAAKTGFFTRVGSDPNWASVAKSVFTSSDFVFLSNLPEENQPKVKLLLEFVYNNHLRKRDPNVTKT